MNHKLLKVLRTGALGLTLTSGLFVTESVMAQDATQVAGQAEQAAQQVEDEASGFDDWGLFGLLGLIGLGGLLKRPSTEVRTVERPATRRVVDTEDDGPAGRI